VSNSSWEASGVGRIVISVYKKDMEWLIPGEMNCIENKDLENCYDRETGFRECEKNTIIF